MSDFVVLGYANGADGADGAPGPIGPQGPTGPQGPAGTNGTNGTNGTGLSDGDKGDITVSGSGAAWAIDPTVVTNAKLANVATATFKGRTTAGTGSPEDLTVAQAKTLLALTEADVASLVSDLAAKASTAVFTAIANGLVPLSGGGTANYLRADGTWQAPAGGGGGATVIQALVNVGSTPVRTASVVVTDATVTTASRIVLGWGGVVDTDENSPDMSEVDFAAVPGTGQFTARISSPRDLIRGIFRLNYVKA